MDHITNLIKWKSIEVNLLEKFMEGFSTRKAGTKRLQEQRLVLDLDFDHQVRSSNIKLEEFKSITEIQQEPIAQILARPFHHVA